MLIKILDEYLLIRWPAATCHKDLIILFERFNDRQLLGSFLNLKHTVKTGIANNCGVCDTYLSQQLLTNLVLYEEMGKAVKYTSILTTIPLKEHLIRAEDARHTIYRYITMLKDMQVVIPELVLDEECHHRMYKSQEPAGIGDSIDREIGNDIRSLVILTHLIA